MGLIFSLRPAHFTSSRPCLSFIHLVVHFWNRNYVINQAAAHRKISNTPLLSKGCIICTWLHWLPRNLKKSAHSECDWQKVVFFFFFGRCPISKQWTHKIYLMDMWNSPYGVACYSSKTVGNINGVLRIYNSPVNKKIMWRVKIRRKSWFRKGDLDAKLSFMFVPLHSTKGRAVESRKNWQSEQGLGLTIMLVLQTLPPVITLWMCPGAIYRTSNCLRRRRRWCVTANTVQMRWHLGWFSLPVV